ncbi:MAG: hypothetical protein V3V36_02050, partial [Candidatus Hydrothermarchaeaceae archaeon]
MNMSAYLSEKEIKKRLKKIKDEFPESLCTDLENALLQTKVSAREFNDIIEAVRKRYEYSLVEP